MPSRSRPSPPDVGLRDQLKDGWFNGQTGQLTTGVVVRSTDTVVDVGCGYGGITGFCAGQGARVLFIDMDEERLAKTEALVASSPAHGYQAILSECDPIPLEDDIGDIIICTEVLEHVRSPRRFLSELVRIAKPGGKLLITVPDERAELMAAATAPANYFEAPNHVRVFASGELQALLLDAGLQIQSEEYIGCFWSLYLPLSWLTSNEEGEIPVDNPHPITDHWTRLWQEVQRHPKGDLIRKSLDSLLPRTHCIVAKKQNSAL